MTVEELAQHVLVLVKACGVQEAPRVHNQALVAALRHPVLVNLLEELPLLYDENFYATNRLRSLQSARLHLGLLAAHLAVRSVVDFGAGTGTWLEAAGLAGAELAMGH
jgi:hypothetical protein